MDEYRKSEQLLSIIFGYTAKIANEKNLDRLLLLMDSRPLQAGTVDKGGTWNKGRYLGEGSGSFCSFACVWRFGNCSSYSCW